ncbi:DUF711 domain-containing protein [Candidatus Poribacteria bacterium]|nr:MAG: DUF711 domain-containing protein [Candidatus Poribacteria bacterium]
MKIRTITTGIPLPFAPYQLQRAAKFNAACRTHFEANGYEVQTIRASCQIWNEPRNIDTILALENDAQALGIEFLSLGTIFPETRYTTDNLERVADVIVQSEILFATVTLTTKSGHIAPDVAESTANIIQQIAHQTDAGYGNLRFAALMNCPPNTPFFPAAFWRDTRTNFGIGWQAADLVQDAFTDAPNLETALQNLKTVMETEGQKIVSLAQAFSQKWGIKFVGIDVSPAPMGDESIADAMEEQLPGLFGERGTLTVAAGITRTLRSISLPLCGYSGLMLPVLEDVGLGKRSEAGHFNLDSLLLYSTVCGTGLDTIPIPGNASISQITAILTDVATLSGQLNKPLSVRLFPVPGLKAGDMTQFQSPYLTNSAVMQI